MFITSVRTRLALLVAVFGLSSLLASCATADVPPDPPPPTSIRGDLVSACAEAGRLTDSDPEAAVALIQRIRSGLPSSTPSAAKAGNSSAPAPPATPGAATASPSGITSSAPPAAEASSSAAPGAPVTSESATALPCEAELLGALAAIGEEGREPPVSTQATRFSKDWDAFVKNWAAPLKSAAPVAAALLAATLILSRLAAQLPYILTPRTDLRIPFRLAMLASGLILQVGGVLWILSVLRGLKGPGALVVPVLFAVLGILILGRFLASRLRLSLEVRKIDGTKDESLTTNLIVRLAQIGSSPSVGIEKPAGTDAKNLDGKSLEGVPGGKILSAVYSVVVTVLGITPWRARADLQAGDDIAVVITRNGRSMGSMLVTHELVSGGGVTEQAAREPAGMEPAPAPANSDGTASEQHKEAAKDPSDSQGEDASLNADMDDNLRLAAAAIATTVLNEYRGHHGLGGARDWRSVGLHCLATASTNTGKGIGYQTSLLIKALKYDAGNRLAQTTLQNIKFRHSANRETLLQYLGWLFNQTVNPKLDSEELQGRLMLSYVNTFINLWQIPGAPYNAERLDYWSALDRAHRLLRATSARRGAKRPLAMHQRPHVAIAYLYLISNGSRWVDPFEEVRKLPVKFKEVFSIEENGTKPIRTALIKEDIRTAQGWIADVEGSLSPRTNFAMGCLKAGSDEPALKTAAIMHLRLGALDDDLRAYARIDPTLAELRSSDPQTFWSIVDPRPRTDLLEVEPFAARQAQLLAFGIATAPKILARSKTRCGRQRLAIALGVGVAELGSYVAYADDFESLRRSELKDLAAEIVAAKSALDRIAGRPQRWDSSLTTLVVQEVVRRCGKVPDRAKLDAWITAVTTAVSGRTL